MYHRGIISGLGRLGRLGKLAANPTKSANPKKDTPFHHNTRLRKGILVRPAQANLAAKEKEKK